MQPEAQRAAHPCIGDAGVKHRVSPRRPVDDGRARVMQRLGATPLGIQRAARYRTVDTEGILDLLLYGLAREWRRGDDRAACMAEVREALDKAVREGLAFEDAGQGRRRFDPAEITNFLKHRGLSGKDRFWEDRFIATQRLLVGDFDPGQDAAAGTPPDLAAMGARRFSVLITRTFGLQHAIRRDRLRLRLPLPIEDEGQRDLTVGIVPPDGVDAEFTMAPGRLDASLAMPSAASVTFGAEVCFTTAPSTPTTLTAEPLDAASIDLYTRLREGLIVVSPRIRQLAAALSEGTRDPRTIVGRIWDFIHDRLKCGVVHYDELSPVYPLDWVLEAGWFDCQLGSALFVALCRVCGIPARLNSGYLLYAPTAAYHYWFDVWFDGRGWLPFDLTNWDISLGGRDQVWRNFFRERLDYRMKTQSLPRLFTGDPTIRFPAAWHLLLRMEEEGASISYVAVDTGTLIYRDQISVKMAGLPSAQG
jgi:hypothetical protein